MSRILGLMIALHIAVLGAGGCSHLPSKSALGLAPAEPRSAPVASESAAAKLELPPSESARACIATAQLMEQSGKIDEAIALYEKARHDDPTQKQVCRRLAVLFDTRGDFARADEEYKKALELYPKDLDLLNDYGYSFYSRGEWAAAESYFREVVRQKADHARAWVNLGLTLAQQQLRDESLTAFEKVLPRDQALCNLAFVLAAHGRIAEARELYAEALRLNPSNPLAQAATTKLASPAGGTP